jgi:hypothetical protein
MDALKSKFYQTYPSKNAPLHGCVRDGYFEDLKLYVGLGFNRKQPGHNKLAGHERGWTAELGGSYSKQT